ncbi:morphogenic membrane protein MmpA [Streptomyces anandii]
MTTTHRSPKPLADPNRPVERAVNAALVLALLTGLAWIGAMIFTVTGWTR